MNIICNFQVPYSLPVPKIGDVFSYQLSIHNRAEWVKWDESLDPSASLPRDIYAGNMIIPTFEAIRYQHVMKLLLENDKPFILSGTLLLMKSKKYENSINMYVNK